MSVETPDRPLQTASAPVGRAYHKTSSHHLRRFAPGPEYLDWSDQLSPFRQYKGAPVVELPRPVWPQAPGWNDMHVGTVPPCKVDLISLSRFIALAAGLSLWKTQGPDRWSLRNNPSSGNLHPIEWYLSLSSVDGVADGIYHYNPQYHVLEKRSDQPFRSRNAVDGEPEVKVALSVCLARTLWKYGERALRYTELDTGHALGSLSFAAIALGWRGRAEGGVSTQILDRWLGLDRKSDYLAHAERESSRCLLSLDCDQHAGGAFTPDAAPGGSTVWTGQANRLGERSLFRWKAAAGAALASRVPVPWPQRARCADRAPARRPNHTAGMTLIRQRRSARVLDPSFACPEADFRAVLRCLLPDASTVWTVRDGYAPRVHLLVLVHAVEGVEPGLYFVPRHREATASLQQSGVSMDLSASVLSDDLPVIQLLKGDLRSWSRACGCHQSLVGNSAFSLIMMGEFDRTLSECGEGGYRQLHHEAGLLGQITYLEANARGLGASGVGCFFDEEVDKLLGLKDSRFQSLYVFALGHALSDERLESGLAWPQEHFPPSE